MSRRTVYVIDGYNVLHALVDMEGGPDLGAQEGRLEDERRRLVDRVASFMGGTSDRAVVVFDSKEAKLQRQTTASHNVVVYFASFHRSADDIIAREVYALSKNEDARGGEEETSIIVVTSDYGLQKTVFLPNVQRCSSRQFILELQAHTRSVAIREDCIRMGHRVEERLDAGSLARLAALRDSLAKQEKESG